MAKKIKINKKKILAVYSLVVSTITLLLGVYVFYSLSFFPLKSCISVLGIIASIFLFKNSNKGFYLIMIWSILQTLIIQVGELIFNFSQFIYFTLPYLKIVELQNSPDVTIAPNIIGVILLVIIIWWRKDLKNEKYKNKK